jgi:hypothetical protein
MSDELHALAALPPEKGPSVPIGYEAGLTTESIWTLCGTENLLPLLGIEPQTSSPYNPLIYPDSDRKGKWKVENPPIEVCNDTRNNFETENALHQSTMQWVGVVQSPRLTCKASLRYVSRANLRLSISLCVSSTISSWGGEITHHATVHD